jgi:hypothetical protein
MKNLNFIIKEKKTILLISFLFFAISLLSLVSFYSPLLNSLVFFIIVLLTIFLAFYNFHWALYLVLGELFLNSMGYIFYIESAGFKISIRMALWAIVLFVFLIKITASFIKNRYNFFKKISAFPEAKTLLYLTIFIIWALIWGLINNNPGDVFSDFNSWLYWLLFFPLYYISLSKDSNIFWKNIVKIFLASIIFLAFESLLLLFLFSHNIPLISDIYSWFRMYYLGEITDMGDGFYRIFFQSQIYVLLGFLILSVYQPFIKKRREALFLLIILSLLAFSLISSFSRSFWLAGILAFLSLSLFFFFKLGFKKSFTYFSFILTSLTIGFFLILALVNLPLPDSEAKFNFQSLSNRADTKTEEAALSSRWSLLPVMGEDIKNNLFLGRGFGARLEYRSSDPRVLEKNSQGVYSTYTFEWGWLDIYLKLGLLGFLFYLYLIFRILKYSLNTFFEKLNPLYLSLSISLIALCTVHFFTPYLNHPLGIGFLILTILLLYKNKERKC